MKNATSGLGIGGLVGFLAVFALWAFFTIPMLVHWFHVIVDFWF